MRTRFWIAVVILLAVFACRKEVDESRTGPAHTSTTTVNPQEVPGNSTAMNPVIPPDKKMPESRSGPVATPRIEVSLDDFEIRMPDTIPHGPQLLHIVAVGKQNHSFAITGNGVAMQLVSPLTRGDSTTLAINLTPGTYTVYCPVQDHRAKGMTRTITVK